jgi:beta-glucosidase
MRGGFLVLLILLLVLPAHSITHLPHSSTPSTFPWSDPAQPIPDRVEALLAAMTETDKLWQLQRPSYTPSIPSTGCGILEFPTIIASSKNATQVAANRNAVQRAFLSAGPGARLGIPASFRLFSIHGAEGFGTTFPEGPGLGATWDVDLAAQVATVVASEGRALGADIYLPVINLWADARFGRQEEGFSEEPTLTSALAAAMVLGAQGSLSVPPDAYLEPPSPWTPDSTPPIATFFKHVGAYGAAAGGLNGARADAPELTVKDIYLRPWRRVAVSGARGAMPSHQTVLNVPAHASPWLLTSVLRGEYNWSSAVFLSDTGDVAALAAFRICAGDAACAALALNAGVDVEQPPGSTFLSLPAAIAQNLTSQAAVDDAVRRILTHKFSIRLFDDPYVNETLAADVVNAPAHRALAQKVAEEGTVLLINRPSPAAAATAVASASSATAATPLLPLPADASLTVAVVGPNGGCGTSGSGAGTSPLCEAQLDFLGNYAEGAGAPPSTGVPTIAESIAASGFAKSVVYARGSNINDMNLSYIPAAVSAAQASDITVAVLGDSTASCGEGQDRDDLDLPGGQLPLLQALVATGRPVVVVLINCRAATFGAADGNSLLAGVSALLVAWRAGQMGGPAVANLLFGAANPSGRLPNSWIKGVGQSNGGASPWLQQRVSLFGGPSTGAEGRRYGGYVDSPNGDGMPLFPFGFGLGYTPFVLSAFAASVDAPGNLTHPLSVSLTVTNAGTAVAGSCVVQVYIQDPVGASLSVRPWKRLVGFVRVADIQPGEARGVALPLRADDVGFVGDDGTLAVRAGTYTLSAGQSSVDDDAAGMQAEVTVGQTYAVGLWA